MSCKHHRMGYFQQLNKMSSLRQQSPSAPEGIRKYNSGLQHGLKDLAPLFLQRSPAFQQSALQQLHECTGFHSMPGADKRLTLCWQFRNGKFHSQQHFRRQKLPLHLSPRADVCQHGQRFVCQHTSSPLPVQGQKWPRTSFPPRQELAHGSWSLL